jgi:hypothetical protein
MFKSDSSTSSNIYHCFIIKTFKLCSLVFWNIQIIIFIYNHYCATELFTPIDYNSVSIDQPLPNSTPSLLENTILLSTLWDKLFHIPHMSKIIWYLSFCARFLSLNVMRYHLSPLRKDIIKEIKDNKCWPGYEEKATLAHCW